MAVSSIAADRPNFGGLVLGWIDAALSQLNIHFSASFEIYKMSTSKLDSQESADRHFHQIKKFEIYRISSKFGSHFSNAVFFRQYFHGSLPELNHRLSPEVSIFFFFEASGRAWRRGRCPDARREHIYLCSLPNFEKFHKFEVCAEI